MVTLARKWCLAVLFTAFGSTAATAQIFQTPPCPEAITPGVLGYDGLIDKDGILFPVVSLFHRTPGESTVVYLTIPERPQTGTKAWELAAVGAFCYWWMGPLGAWKVVEETAKFGYVRELVACSGGGPQPPLGWIPDDPYSAVYDPYSTRGDCGGGGENGQTGGSTCNQIWVVIEISYDGGATWQSFWEGYATVCT